MTDQNLRAITSEILLQLEGDERIADIIAEVAVDTLDKHGVDGSSDEGFEALMDICSNITLYSNL